MWLDGRPYGPRNPLDARNAGVAMIYQELSLAPHLSVMENILLGMEPTHGPLMDWKMVRTKARAALEQLDRADIPLDTPTGRLSVGEQQLVEIARAVAIGCRVLVLDEPTSSLTAKDIERLFELVRRLRQQGHAIVYISHFLEEVQEISDRFTVLRDGQTVGTGPTASATTDQIVAMMVGRNVQEMYPRSKRTAGEVLLEIENVAGPAKPQSASLTLRRGEVLGIAGLVGAGRTELLRSIFGLAPVKSGTIRVGGCVGAYSPTRRWAQGMGMVSEDRKIEGLALGLSIADNMTLSCLPAFVNPGAGPGVPKMDRPHLDSLPRRAPDRGRSFGRQSAKGGAGAAAPPWRRYSAAGRAHARHRRRFQGPHLQDDRRACLRWPRHPHGQQLPARVDGHLRPHRRHVPGRAGAGARRLGDQRAPDHAPSHRLPGGRMSTAPQAQSVERASPGARSLPGWDRQSG